MLKLYSYFRSSAAYRVRIALYLKQLQFENVEVHLVNNGGEHNSAAYRLINPSGEIPSLVDGDFTLSQSMAILIYLDGKEPKPLLFPADLKMKARCLQMCELINSGIHPIQNLKVLNRLTEVHKFSPEERRQWAAHWIAQGFEALEKILQKTAGQYALGDEITAADLFIIPQIYNANRFKVEMKNYTLIDRIGSELAKHPAFIKAAPENQASYQA